MSQRKWDSSNGVVVSNIPELKHWLAGQIPHWPDRLVVLLSGPMGVGKTQLVREILSLLGSKEVSSPSFAIHNCYQTKDRSVDHIDLYRLEDDADLESTGFWDLFSQDKGWIFVEWADRLPIEAFPLHWSLLDLNLSLEGSQSRRLQFRMTKSDG
ncbi:MAG: tRNA (adenosine(37)-N6)-threonylcarbamoyltransferase complex ATPase subunit type 1 TsaE [Bdellovibrionales bacterium]|nr:tRNA (adenosine(37)-N6)-threonylcarbamoyltransferase complex ATPase subunit type 1 TsaE [Bdellovibrionales bacterium]